MGARVSLPTRPKDVTPAVWPSGDPWDLDQAWSPTFYRTRLLSIGEVGAGAPGVRWVLSRGRNSESPRASASVLGDSQPPLVTPRSLISWVALPQDTGPCRAVSSSHRD